MYTGFEFEQVGKYTKLACDGYIYVYRGTAGDFDFGANSIMRMFGQILSLVIPHVSKI
jgi:hypothetical protein